MKKLVRAFFLFVSFSFLISHAVQAASGILLNSDQATVQNGGEKQAQLVYSPKLSRAEVETFMGRKMTFMERVGFGVNKKKFVKTTNQVKTMADSDKTNGMAIAGFVLSLLCAPLGIIFSAIALGQIKETGQRGYGFAIAGLVIGIAVTALALISLL